MMRLMTITLVLSALFTFWACSIPSEEPSSPKSDLEELPDQESWHSTIIITRDGRRMAEVWAGYIATYDKKIETILKDSVHVDFYDQEGQHNSVLTAEEGTVYNQNNNLVATGNVVVVSDSGVVLETEELKWDNQRQQIISEVPVIFTTETEKLIGDSFISDPNLQNYEIKNARGYTQRVIPLEK